MMMSGLGYGNATALCNDPCMADPLDEVHGEENHRRYEEAQNTRVMFFHVRGFPVPFMFTIRPVEAGGWRVARVACDGGACAAAWQL